MRPRKFVVSSEKLPLAVADQFAQTLVAQLPGLIARADEYFEEGQEWNRGLSELIPVSIRRSRIKVLGLDPEQNHMELWLYHMRYEFDDVTWQWSQMTTREENELSIHRVRIRLRRELAREGSGYPDFPVAF